MTIYRTAFSKCLVLICFILVLTTGVNAQQVFPSDEALLNQYQISRDKERNDLLSALDDKAEKTVTAPRKNAGLSDAVCISLSKIKLSGYTVFKEEELSNIVRPYENRCVGLKSIDGLTKSITQYFFDHGYIATRVYIPAQDIGDGILELVIAEGILEDFYWNGQKSDNRRAIAAAFPNQTETILNLRNLEQGMQNFNRLPSQTVKLGILPGSKADFSVVNLAVKTGDRFRHSITVDNSGSENTGKNAFKYNFSADNVFKLNDQVSFGWTGTQSGLFDIDRDADKTSDTLSTSIEIPYGYWLFSASISKYNYNSRFVPTGVGVATNTYGATDSIRLSAKRVLSRNQRSIHSMKMELGRVKTANYYDLGTILSKIDNQSRTQSYAQLRYDFSKRNNSSVWSSSFTIKAGLGAFGASSQFGPSYADYNGNKLFERNYVKFRFDLGYNKAVNLFKTPVSISTNIAIEGSRFNTLNSEKFAITGAKGTAALGARGLSLSTNARHIVSKKYNISANYGLHVGYVDKDKSNGSHHRVGVLKLGLNGGFKNGAWGISINRLLFHENNLENFQVDRKPHVEATLAFHF